MKLAGIAAALGALMLVSPSVQAAYCAGASHMGCYPGIDGSGRPPMAMYEAAVEGLKEARNPAEAKLAIQAMYDAFNPRAADWRAMYCNGHAGGPQLYQSCIQSMH